MLRLNDRVINFAHLITVKRTTTQMRADDKAAGLNLLADVEGDSLAVHLQGHVLQLDGPDVEHCWGFLRHLAVMPGQPRAHHIEFIGDQVFDLARLLVARRCPDPAPGAGYAVELTFGGAHAEMVRGENATRIWAALRDLATAPPAPREGEG